MKIYNKIDDGLLETIIDEEDINLAKTKTTKICNFFNILHQNNIQTSFIKQNSDNSYISKKCIVPPIYWCINKYPSEDYKKRNPDSYLDKFDPPLVEHFYKHNKNYNKLIKPKNEAQKYLLSCLEWNLDIFDNCIIKYNFETKKISLYPTHEPSTHPIYEFERSPITDSERRYMHWELVTPAFKILEFTKNIKSLKILCGFNDYGIKIKENEIFEIIITDILE